MTHRHPRVQHPEPAMVADLQSRKLGHTFAWLKRMLVACLACFLLLAPSAQAEDDEREITEKDFVLGNTLTVLLHEVGHALVDLWALPVLGREEDAADTFSIIYLLDTIETDQDLSDEQVEQIDDALFVTAASWLIFAEESDLQDAALYADEHSLDMQRFFSHMCLLVGREEEVYSGWLDDFEVEDDTLDLERCVEQTEIQASDWRYLLEAERDETWKDQGEAGISIKIERGQTRQHRRYEDWLRNWAWLPYLERKLEKDLKLPQPLLISFASCEEANAFYEPDAKEVVMCYELLEVLEEQFVGS